METAKFWNKVAVKYAAKPVSQEVIYNKKLSLTREVLKPHMTALELGCGTGSTAIINAPQVDSYYASDISDKMVQIACNKPQVSQIPGLTFSIESIEASLKKHQNCDVILAHSLLHLLPDPKSTIEAIYSALKPGGIFISSTVCMGEHLAFFKWIAPVGQRLGLMPSLNVFKHRELKHWHKECGFSFLTDWTPEENKHTCFLIVEKPL